MIELENLDDKHFQRIFDEAVATIPTLTENWTDNNPQDTGIMLLEVLAAMTEMQNFYQNQIGERFYDSYLELVTEKIPVETTCERIHRFSQECMQTNVAVVLRDYERLVLSSPFFIEKAHASYDKGFVKIAIFSKNQPLDDTAIEALGRWLEPFRLLTTRLKIEQAVCLPIVVDCSVTLSAKLGRESICKERLEAILKLAIEEKSLGESLAFDSIRSEILALPEVVRINSLNIDGGINSLDAEAYKNSMLQADDIKISFV